ncbi:MAG TPA: nitronate monooxygenase [Aestuariivirgaceae bacterium]|nr:nitronate monooxygenase [Aestuariivirgaceae bacterium]
MSTWTDRRILDLFGIDSPIIQAPMAGASSPDMVIAVSEAGGLGSLGCAMHGPEQLRADLGIIGQRTSRPINVNFFCHGAPEPDAGREAAWLKQLAPYYAEFGLDAAAISVGPLRAPFNQAMCDVVTEFKPPVVSFHFGLPERRLMERVRQTGAKIISSATSVAEARWLEAQGCDAVIAQGYEAGGHRGMFLSSDIAGQTGTMALVPQVVDAVGVPVIAAGGIADGRGIVAALALGAAAVQIGTAYLFCPESMVTPLHRAALKSALDDDTVLTNVFTGRPARGIANRFIREVGPISPQAPQFPLAANTAAPLRAAAEARGSGDFSALWSGQAVALGRELGAGELTLQLAADAAERLSALSVASRRNNAG